MNKNLSTVVNQLITILAANQPKIESNYTDLTISTKQGNIKILKQINSRRSQSTSRNI